MRRQLQVAGCWLLGAGIAAGAQIQMQAGPVKAKSFVAYVAEPQMVQAGKSGRVAVRFHIADGYHVNSHAPTSELLVRTTLSLDAADGVTVSEFDYPAGKAFSFGPDADEKLDVYSGDFTVHLALVASAGEHTVAGTLKYQACDNKECYPPKTLPVQILFTAK